MLSQGSGSTLIEECHSLEKLADELREIEKTLSLLLNSKEEEKPGYWTNMAKTVNRVFFVCYVNVVCVFLIVIFVKWNDTESWSMQSLLLFLRLMVVYNYIHCWQVTAQSYLLCLHIQLHVLFEWVVEQSTYIKDTSTGLIYFKCVVNTVRLESLHTLVMIMYVSGQATQVQHTRLCLHISIVGTVVFKLKVTPSNLQAVLTEVKQFASSDHTTSLHVIIRMLRSSFKTRCMDQQLQSMMMKLTCEHRLLTHLSGASNSFQTRF